MWFRNNRGNKNVADVVGVLAQEESRVPGTIIAAIVAAIAAESGLSPHAFRIVAVSPAGYETGFNTPIWGRVERFFRA